MAKVGGARESVPTNTAFAVVDYDFFYEVLSFPSSMRRMKVPFRVTESR